MRFWGDVSLPLYLRWAENLGANICIHHGAPDAHTPSRSMLALLKIESVMKLIVLSFTKRAWQDSFEAATDFGELMPTDHPPSTHPPLKRSFIRGGVANRLWHTPQANTRNPHQPQNVCSRATSVPEQNGWWNMIMCGESSFSSIEFVKISMARQWEAFIMELASGLANHNASEWSVSGSTKTSLVQMKLIFDFILTKCWASVCLFVIWLRKEGWKEARSRGCVRL